MRVATPGIRQRISDAAARLFAVERFHEVRMDDIATEAGVSKGTLYRYFSDKEDLYRALIVTASKQILENVDARIEHATGPREKLEQVVAALIDFFDENVYFFDLLQRVEALDSTGRNFPWSKTRQEFIRRVTDITHQCQDADAPYPLEPSLCALMLLGSVRAVLRFGTRPRPAGLARQLVRVYLHGLTCERVAQA